MASCVFDRPLLFTWWDGEASAEEAARVEAHLHGCAECPGLLDRTGAAVVAFLLHSAGPAARGPLPMPSEGFTERVMARIRGAVDDDAPPAEARPRPRMFRPAPGRVGPDRAGVDDDAPPEVRPRVLPPAAGLRLLRRPAVAAAALATAAAAVAAFLLLSGEPGDRTPGHGIESVGKGAIVARTDGLLRWTDPRGRDVAGSEWTARDDLILPGEILHSPAPSSFHLRLPGRGRLHAGPSCWLALGQGNSVALLEGALTGAAGEPGTAPGAPLLPSGPLVVETPAGTARSSGEMEVSVLASGGAASGRTWLGSLAEAYRSEGGAGPAVAGAPPVAALFYARRGTLEVSLSPGPVRNSLERHTLREGEALAVLEGKAFLLPAPGRAGVDDDAPPEGPTWVDGLPTPPESRFRGRRGPVAPEGPPGPSLTSGPVRNQLERILTGEDTSPPERAAALSVYESVGGTDAVRAAAEAAGDRSVLVRATAVRVLALNAWADRAKALEALRRLAHDPDEGVAVSAIRALKALEDTEALPALEPLLSVDDDAPPDAGFPLAARVYAAEAALHLGGPGYADEAAALMERAGRDPALERALTEAVTKAFLRMDTEVLRGMVDDPRAGVRAAALSALGAKRIPEFGNLATAKFADPSDLVKKAAIRAFLAGGAAGGLEAMQVLSTADKDVRNCIVQEVGFLAITRPGFGVPAFVADLADGALTDPDAPAHVRARATVLLDRAGRKDRLQGLMATGSPGIRQAILEAGGAAPDQVLASLGSGDPGVRRAGFARLPAVAGLPEAEMPAERLLAAIREHVPARNEEARYVGASLATLLRDRGVPDALETLIALSVSDNADVRAGALHAMASLADRKVVADRLESLLRDPSDRVSLDAARALHLAVLRGRWAGSPLTDLFPLDGARLSTRLVVALAARRTGIPAADEAFGNELRNGSSSIRRGILQVHGQGLDAPLSGLDKSILRDPDPTVRALALLALEEGPAAAAARELADDPVAEVRALALATLEKGGDAGAAAALRALVRDLKARGESATGFLGTLPEGAPDLASLVLTFGRTVAASGNMGGTLASGDRLLAMRLLKARDRAEAVAAGDTIRASSDPERRLQAAQRLGRTFVPEAVIALVPLVDPAAEPDPRVRAAALESLVTLIGFTPGSGWPRYLEDHRTGILFPEEVRARGAR